MQLSIDLEDAQIIWSANYINGEFIFMRYYQYINNDNWDEVYPQLRLMLLIRKTWDSYKDADVRSCVASVVERLLANVYKNSHDVTQPLNSLKFLYHVVFSCRNITSIKAFKQFQPNAKVVALLQNQLLHFNAIGNFQPTLF